MKLIEIVNNGDTSKSTNAYLIESNNIKVFPCSYRGFDESGNIYDPEASGFTEYNFANIYGKQTKLISWSGGLLKCIIDGYYFEIKNITPDNLCIKNDLNNKYELYKFAIVLDTIDIVGNYKTKVLKPIYTSDVNYLDTKIDGVNCFTGLVLIPEDDSIGGAVYFSPCKLDETNNTAVIDWQAYRLTDALTTGEGDGSVRMLGTVKTGEDNESISTVCHAAGENAFAVGNNTAASGDFSAAGGVESAANHKNSIAIGDHVNTSADNQVVFGAYNKENAESALIIGNGTSADKKNILEISKAGDINAAGKLDVAGNISSSNGGITLEKNGFISIHHSYEYQKIPDTATYDSTIIYYEKNAETDEMTEKAVTAKTFASLKNNLYIKLHHLSSLDNNGNLLVDGNAQANKKLTVKEQAEVDGDITGHGNLTINGTGKTHAFTLGSQANIGDYGSITVWGKNEQKKKTKIFEITESGAATIAKTLTVGADKLVVDAKGVSINNKKVTIANPTTIGNNLDVDGTLDVDGNLDVAGTATITDNNVVTTINKDTFDYNKKFTVDVNGNITNANSLSLTKGGIDANGKITGESLEVSGASIGTTGKVELIDGLSIFKTEVPNSDPKTYKAIKFSKESIENIKDNDSAGKFNHKNALVITNEFTNNTAATSNQASGLHVAGMLTAAGDIAIFESDNTNKYITTKITQGGTAYFKQGLLVGGTVAGRQESKDTVTFRVGLPSKTEEAFADLKGNLNIKKYNETAGGNLKVEGNTDISGDLNVGKIKSSGQITATKFNATSDIRKKTNIKDFEYKSSILDLPVKEFEFIGDETHTKNIGCIAQDLQKICPEIVHEDKDGYLSIEETKLVYLLLQEVKELKKEINALKGE